MRKILLFTLLIVSSYGFSQVMTITDENDQDVTNTTIVYEINAADILADNDLNIGFDGHINNNSSSTKTITIFREVENIPTGAQSYLCFELCAPYFIDTQTSDVDANSAGLAQLHYVPKGNVEDATVTWLYTYDGGTEEARITFEYRVITGIDELNAQNTFVAYPNPANDNVNISYNVTEASQIVFYNIVGEQVKQLNVTSGINTINVETSDLPAGTYFYSMISDSKITATKRLVIKH